MEVVIEAIPSWYWLYDLLEDEGFKVKLSHPLKTKAIAYAEVKTDKVDSATLAYLRISFCTGDREVRNQDGRQKSAATGKKGSGFHTRDDYPGDGNYSALRSRGSRADC